MSWDQSYLQALLDGSLQSEREFVYATYIIGRLMDDSADESKVEA